jgi:hypothetical protein
MSYTPTTDFLALLRNVAGGEAVARMPGLDYVVAALARAGLFSLSVGQTAPLVNQATTVWLKPSQPSWVAEGTVYLWNAAAGTYQVATTTTLWSALLGLSGYSFQSAATAAANIASGTSLLAVQRAAPAATALILPAVGSRGGRSLQIVDWSTGIVAHAVTLTPAGTETIMQQPSWTLLSTAVQLAGVTLYPSPDLNGWVIAP